MQPVKEVLAVLPLFKENNKENNTEKTGIAVLMNDNSQYSGTIFFMGVDEEILNREEDRKLFREIGIIIQNRINRNRRRYADGAGVVYRSSGCGGSRTGKSRRMDREHRPGLVRH